MSIILYNIGIRGYVLLIRFFSLFNKKAAAWVSGRKNWRQQLSSIEADDRKRIWFHCASLGEFEQGRTLIEAIKKSHPDIFIILSFFSPSGFEMRKNYAFADLVCYLPSDNKRNARDFVKIINPSIAFFVKYEFWYFYMKELFEKKIPVYLVSGIFRPDMIFFRPYGGWYKKMLGYYRHFFVQDASSADLLKEHGFSNVTISGDTRVDRVAQIKTEGRSFPEVEKFTEGKFTFVIGSSWEKDEEVLLPYVNEKMSEGCKCIIAPHEIHPSHIQSIMHKLKRDYILYTDIARYKGEDVLIINNIGMLSSLYQYARFAYIGGGFSDGIHNILEPAVFGIPVIFGPNHHKFMEAIELRKRGAAFCIRTYEQLTDVFNRFISDHRYLNHAGKASADFIIENTGSTERIMKVLSL